MLRLALGVGLTAIFLLLLAWYVSSHLDEFRGLLERPIARWRIALICLSLLLVYAVNAEIVRKALRMHAVEAPFRENLSLNLAASAANYLLPFKGAVGLRALYMHQSFGLRYRDFISQLVAVSIITLGISSLFALPGLLSTGLGTEGEEGGRRAALLLSLYFLLVIVLGALTFLLGGRGKRLPAFLQGFADSWGRLRGSPSLLGGVILLDALYYLLWCAVNWLSLSAFQVSLSPLEVCFYTSMQIHSLIINLTPAGLGVVEAASVLALGVLDFTPAAALMAQGLSRLCAAAVLAVSGAAGWAYLAFKRRQRKGEGLGKGQGEER
jgi:uncharacterized membrane protein YbhN (UPF0104 family)